MPYTTLADSMGRVQFNTIAVVNLIEELFKWSYDKNADPDGEKLDNYVTWLEDGYNEYTEKAICQRLNYYEWIIEQILPQSHDLFHQCFTEMV